jgi:hypothetical protein
MEKNNGCVSFQLKPSRRLAKTTKFWYHLNFLGDPKGFLHKPSLCLAGIPCILRQLIARETFRVFSPMLLKRCTIAKVTIACQFASAETCLPTTRYSPPGKFFPPFLQMSLRGRSSRSNPRLQWETASFLAVTSYLDYWKKRTTAKVTIACQFASAETCLPTTRYSPPGKFFPPFLQMSLRGRSSRSNPRLQWETASFLAVTSHLDYWKKLFWTAIWTV